MFFPLLLVCCSVCTRVDTYLVVKMALFAPKHHKCCWRLSTIDPGLERCHRDRHIRRFNGVVSSASLSVVARSGGWWWLSHETMPKPNVDRDDPAHDHVRLVEATETRTVQMLGLQRPAGHVRLYLKLDLGAGAGSINAGVPDKKIRHLIYLRAIELRVRLHKIH